MAAESHAHLGSEKPITVRKSVRYVAKDTCFRISSIVTRIESSVIGLAALLPLASAETASKETLGQPSNDTLVLSDVNSLGTPFNFTAWKIRGNIIRNGNRLQCFGNLSIALAQVGPVMASETAGASGALSLLPTAGALVGAPAKELWVLYKLMPLAGVLSMMLSLGGNIVPTNSSEYEVNAQKFNYGGYVASSKEHTLDDNINEPIYKGNSGLYGHSAQSFAARVERKSRQEVIGRKSSKIALGILVQLFWLAILFFACYLTAAGGVVSWACKAWYWMYFWYVCVMLSSFLENIAGVPFTRQWTMRVSRAPKVRISPDAPTLVVADDVGGMPVNSREVAGREVASRHEVQPQFEEDIEIHPIQTDNSAIEAGQTWLKFQTAIRYNLEARYNTTGRVIIDRDEPWAAPRIPFYVIISLEGVSLSHAMLRVVSKAISVGVFAAGTAAFASATMITISVALTVLCLVLGAGVFGRVAAMWMASEMMITDPVLHAVVKTRNDASEYISNILAVEGLSVEIMGHIVVNGRCIGRYNKWFRAASFFGVLAPAFDITSLAQNN